MIRLASLVFLLPIAPACAGEVKAGKGPVQLTLRLLTDKVPDGQNPWYRLELKNTSSKSMQIREDAFIKDARELIGNSWSKQFTYIDIQTIDGGKVEADSPPLDFDPAIIGRCKKNFKNIVQAWTDSGLSEKEIEERARRHECRWMLPESSKPKFLVLEPGKSKVPPPHYFSKRKRLAAAPEDFSELYGFWLKPGRYRLRAVYDWAFLNGDQLQKYEKKKRPEWVTFETPFIEFEVIK
jgi:hypothetical protein